MIFFFQKHIRFLLIMCQNLFPDKMTYRNIPIPMTFIPAPTLLIDALYRLTAAPWHIILKKTVFLP